ncbi:uncharacterized protein DUF4783 [Mucilaginibacter frigoritolerans]|uniref:Uncharacterized protein DUF4783 n=1 Tax=Mucilaginibacter frigoritolerans TaxID=652788 RepID=A0A562UAW0_9SPHI|nr:DUF4783 domain-containing protein [Mucilaginibacter frigoritolerans]TWJ02505.1 uncharacterized protein DUF4783 [Mucilaginibacter frigoritolerans]
MIKLLCLPLLFISYLVPGGTFADPIDNVATLIKQGDVHALSAMFAPSVEISILNEENVYSKTQAELVLTKFFNENKPRLVKMLHRVNSNPNYYFGVITMNTDKSAFRIACTLKQIDKHFELIEMRIETEKVK